MIQHQPKALGKEMGRLSRQMVLMGSYCELQLKDARNAFKGADRDLAAQVIDSDEELSRLKRKIEADILCIICTRRPEALELRMLMSLLKIACELERIGDHAAMISRQVITLTVVCYNRAGNLILDMMDNCLAMLTSAISAVMDMNPEEAIRIW